MSRADAALGIAAVAATRILCRSHYLYDLDSVNFALGMLRFDPAAHQPHPPGYFLYICLARLVSCLLPDPNTALVAVSIAGSCAAAGMIYVLTREWFGQNAARFSLLVFVVSPLCWFHGIVALTYIVETFFSALIGYLCWRAYRGERAFAVPAAAVLALAAGFRPSSALLLSPLLLFSIRRAGARRLGLAVVAAAAVALAWFLPMTTAAGGLQHYLEAIGHLWATVPGQRTTLASPWLAVARIFTIAWIFILVFGAGAIFLLWSPAKQKARPSDPPASPRLAPFVAAWMAPGLCFFALVFLNYVNSGYLLVVCPPAFAWVARRLWLFLAAPSHRALRWAAVGAGIAANCALFFFAPLYCSFRSVREFEGQLAPIVEDFGKLDPSHIMIVGFDSHFLGYRHAGYYLPHFLTVQYPELAYPGGKRVFEMLERRTEVVSHIPLDRYDRFVFFPMPADAEYVQYVSTVQARFPKGSLTSLDLGRRKVVTGPISLLPVLFPETAHPGGQPRE